MAGIPLRTNVEVVPLLCPGPIGSLFRSVISIAKIRLPVQGELLQFVIHFYHSIMRSLFIRTFILPSFFIIGSRLCAAPPLAITLTPSDHNGYNISCNSGNDGAIDLTISGGTPPYNISWTTKETTEDISGLSAGYYAVGVVDAIGSRVEADITLVEPAVISPYVEIPKYPSGYHISCYECFNGSAEVQVTGGVAPYT